MQSFSIPAVVEGESGKAGEMMKERAMGHKYKEVEWRGGGGQAYVRIDFP